MLWKVLEQLLPPPYSPIRCHTSKYGPNYPACRPAHAECLRFLPPKQRARIVDHQQQRRTALHLQRKAPRTVISKAQQAPLVQDAEGKRAKFRRRARRENKRTRLRAHAGKTFDNGHPAATHGGDVQAVGGIMVDIVQIKRAVRAYISIAFSSSPSCAASTACTQAERLLSCTVIGS